MNILFPTWKSFGVEDIKETFEELGYKVSLYEREPKNYRIDPRYKSEIKKYIEQEVNICQEKLRWFEISFLESLYSVKPIYSIYHYGKACLVNQMSNSELYNIEEKLKANKIIYEINV